MLNTKIRLYKKPFITGAVFLILGIFMFAYGVFMAEKMHNSDFYALVTFGVIFLITAAVILIVYGALEAKFQRIINNDTLLSFCIDDSQYQKTATISADDIKTNNKITLWIMLFFCVILAVLGPFIAEDGYIISLIAIGLAVFLSLSALIITNYRVNKLKKGSKRVILSKDGAYVCGEFHCWNIPGSRLIKAQYISKDKDEGYIKIEYGAATLPGPTVYSCIIPIPNEIEQKAQDIVALLMCK